MTASSTSAPSSSSSKTLERVLSKSGVASRTEARRIIHARRVRVNGRIIEDPDHWVHLTKDRVTLDGRPLRSSQPVYLLLYKPTGYVTTRHDPEKRPTVYDLLDDASPWVFPVGRLDLDTSGLLILTNDTQFGERLTNPKFKIPKTYLVKTATLLDDAALEQLRQGVVLSDGPTLPAQVVRQRDTARHTFLEITITEGRNRQVRRMVEALGTKVLKLVRTRIGPLSIGTLPIGRHRSLTISELQALKLQ
jgi:23S rRNA pseudouridine2605 synthase